MSAQGNALGMRLRITVTLVPRASPWAGIARPFGAEDDFFTAAEIYFTTKPETRHLPSCSSIGTTVSIACCLFSKLLWN